MGSLDSAESCELVGTYLLCQLPVIIKSQAGMYRDDGLGAFRESPRRVENIKKKICKVFNDNGLKITIEANKKIVDLLDVTLDPNKGTHEPYTKPNNTPLYVDTESNHPPSITKNIPIAINKDSMKSPRTKNLSKRRHHYMRAQSTKAATATSLNSSLKALLTEKSEQRPTVPINRRYPGTGMSCGTIRLLVKTNVGRKFLNIVKDLFKKGNPLHIFFNKNTIKVSYSCLPNLI